MIEIVEANFITSAPNIKVVPPNEEQNEVVFLARSNTGKSSLLNALTNNKKLAKVSATPGKTRLINYFDVVFLDRETDEKRSAKFVDLPGFGYAKVAKTVQEDWKKNLTNYIANREQIKLFIHLIDSRHPDLAIDRDVEEFLQSVQEDSQTVLKVFTKIDKLNQKEQSALMRKFPGAIMSSSTKKRGIAKIMTVIYETLYEEEE
jgi:GTP-binding protein